MADTPESGGAETPETPETTEKAAKKSRRSSSKDWMRRLEPNRRQRSNIVTIVLVVAIVGGLGAITWPKWKRHVEGLVPERSQIFASEPDDSGTDDPPESPTQSATDPTTEPGDGASPPLATGSPPPPPPKQPASRNEERLASMAARLELMAERIDRLEAKAGRPPPVDAAMRQRVDDLSGSQDSLDKRIAGIESVVTTVREESRNRRADALVLAVGHLREAMMRGMPFAQELAGLRSVAGGNQAVLRAAGNVAPRAKKGVPTRAALHSRFDGTAAAAARAAMAPEKGGWVNRTVARLSNVVTVRRTGADVAGDTPGAVIARGEAALKRGDLAGAVQQLDALSGAPAQAMAEWLADARARINAEQAMANLTQIAIARIAAAQKAASGG